MALALELSIPSNKFSGFRDKVMSHQFVGDDPTLTRHVRMSGKREFATFVSECAEDLEWVMCALPNDSVAYIESSVLQGFGWTQYDLGRAMARRASRAMKRAMRS